MWQSQPQKKRDRERERYRKIERGRERGGSKHGKARFAHASKGDRVSGDSQKQRQRQRKRQRQRLSVERESGEGEGEQSRAIQGGQRRVDCIKNNRKRAVKSCHEHCCNCRSRWITGLRRVVQGERGKSC